MRPLLLLALLTTSAPAHTQSGAPDAEFAQHFTQLEGTRPAQWRVVWTRRPATEATLSWSTAHAGELHRVLWDSRAPGAGGERYEHQTRSARDGRYSSHEKDESAPAYYHHVRLSGLAPSTTYRFRMESDGERSPELFFTTAPADERPFALLSGGDSRSGIRARCYVNLALSELHAGDPSILALCHGGDYVFDGLRWDQWSAWLTHHELTVSDAGRVLPLLPTRGNHDRGPLFDEIFDDPGGATRNHYTSELGAVRLLTLNSNISAAGGQLDWLESELACIGAETSWLLTNYHRPLYPAVKTPGTALPFWAPLFDRYGVDVSLESDGHCIKRTPGIKAGELHPEGVVYVGEGGLGVPQRIPRRDDWYLHDGFVGAGHHVIRLDFAPDTLRVRFLELGELTPSIDANDSVAVVAPQAEWRYHVGTLSGDDWTSVDFDDSAWPLGLAGFGYGDDDDRTVLEDMRGNHDRVHLRASFAGDSLDERESLSLMCRFDDAFVAYLNGVEVARGGIEAGAEPDEPDAIQSHEARTVEVFELARWRALLRPEANTLSLVGFNRMSSDRDFSLDPWLVADHQPDSTPRSPGLRTIDDTRLERRQRP